MEAIFAFNPSLPPSPSPTEDEFNSFHSIDRQLYKKLIINYGRDISESMNVLAFLLWLEKEHTGTALINQALAMPCDLINQLVNECAACLKCVEKEHFSNSEAAFKLNLLPNLVGKEFQLRFLFDHRILVLQGVAKMMNQVCVRAFRDINQNALSTRPQPLVAASATDGPAADHTRPPMSSAGFGLSGGPSTMMALQPQGLHPSLLNQAGNAEELVASDDRTIFLTFSNGYPVLETEIREFFTRKFGNIVEEIRMQPVEIGQQALYARMVVRPASAMEWVLRGGGKTKYVINGKHVCVRKFVAKFVQSAAASVASSEVSRTVAPASPLLNPAPCFPPLPPLP